MSSRRGAALAAALLAWLAAPAAYAAEADVYCYNTATAKFVPCTTDVPLAVDATFSGTVEATSAVTAIAALPTLAPGTQVPQASLAGATYVQPVFGSTAGGGTQVDATHGLPVAGIGTAGSAAGGVLTVQGAASMTKLLVTPDSVALPANQSVNVSQVNATTIQVGSGAAGSGSARVVVGQDVTTIAGSAPGTAGTPSTNVVTVQGIGSGTSVGVTCTNCSGSGLAQTDESTFTPGGMAAFAASGGFFQTTATNNALTNLQIGTFQVTAQRALFTNLRNASGTEIGTSSTPVQVSLANTGANGTAIVVSEAALDAAISANKVNVNLSSVAAALNLAVNTAQVNGVTTSTGAGAVGTGSQRVSVGQDTTTLAGSAPGTAGTASANVVTVQGIASMTKLLVTPDSVALPANQSVNMNQIAGTASAVNTGNASAGTLRVVLATDQPQLTNKLLVTPDANSSVNLSQVAGSTVATAATGIAKVGLTDASGNALNSTSNALNVNCANCSGSGVSQTDEGTFTAGSAAFASGGGFFQTTATSNALTNGQFGTFQTTANRALFVNFRNASGTEIGTSTTPVQVSLANTGSNATAVKVDNSAVTQPVSGTVTVTQTTASNLNAAVVGVGSAGTASGGVLTVQGVASMTPLQVSVANTGANATAIKVDGSAATQPVSGTVTANAGTNLNTSLLALESGGNLATIVTNTTRLAQGSTTSGQTGGLTLAAVTTAAPSYTTAQTSPLSLTTAGDLRAVISNTAFTANAGTNLNTSALALETGGNLATLAGGVSSSVYQSNTKQVNGVTTLAGAGAVGTGAQRVAVGQDITTIAGSAPGTAGTASSNVVTVQGIASMTKLLVTPDSVALPANQSVNVAQMNGVTTTMGNGTSGTGVQRVAIASDNTAVSGMGVGATGAAPPANGVYLAGNASGATGGQLKGLITCDLHAVYDASDNGSITLVTGVASRKVYVCGYTMATGGTATNLKLVEGSNANCASSPANLTPAYQLVANDRIGHASAFWDGMVVSTNGYYVCINASAGNAHQAEIWYTIL